MISCFLLVPYKYTDDFFIFRFRNICFIYHCLPESRHLLYPCSHFLVFFHLAVGNIDTNEGDQRALEELQVQLMNRKVWMASSIHKGEEKGNFLAI